MEDTLAPHCGLMHWCASIALATLAYAAPPPADGFVDSRLCADCHSDQARSYQLTGMGRSFYRPQPANTIEDYTRNNTYFHAASNTHFTMIQRDGKYYQRRYQIGYQGKETNIEEKQIDFVMGSGSHARTYLHLTSRNTLQQLPLGWYSENGGQWGMSPGYDYRDHAGSRRQITYECMFCHNAYPKIPEANQEYGAEPVFESPLPEGVDCQRCHGPGGRHIAIASSAGARNEEIRGSIVNPARLTPEREMDVCAQCHLQTNTTVLSHSVLRYNRGPFSYRAGEPLNDFRLTFDRPADSATRFEIVNSVYRLRQSACFAMSAGKMRCTTCHDPHRASKDQNATDQYNSVCRQCHGASFEKLIATGAHTAASDCVGCHMPKRRTDDVVNAVMTDHYIQRRKPERDLLAEMPETPSDSSIPEEVVAYDPKLGQSAQDRLDLAVAQVRDVSNRDKAIPRLARLIETYRPAQAGYYVDLADALEAAGDFAKAVGFYEATSQRKPGSAVVLQKLGTVLMETGQLDSAVSVLQDLSRTEPGNPLTWDLLGQVYARQGKDSQAVAAFQKALTLDPDRPEARNNMGSILAAKGDLTGAEWQFRESMRIQPNLAEAWANLARVLALKLDPAQATYYFQVAIALKPDYASARLEYARMLDAGGQAGEAEKQAASAVQANPNMGEAHELLGILLAGRGSMAGALREFREAVRIMPASGNAQLQLGAALATAGDVTQGLVHLRLAAQTTAAEVRQAALALLKKYGAAN